MPHHPVTCIRCQNVSASSDANTVSGCVKYGKTKAGRQRYFCKGCGCTFLLYYTYKAYCPETNDWVTHLLTEGCGIRSIARLLLISATTVIRRILQIARSITKPPVALFKEYQIDELRTFYKSRNRLLWIVSVLRRDTGEVIDFAIGRRTLSTLKRVTDTALLAGAHKVYTDKLSLYKQVLPSSIHCNRQYGTNRVERKHLSMRTHLKRLSRRTICFSRSRLVLEACVRIYFWGGYRHRHPQSLCGAKPRAR
jgi:insertion element IS1 protein InsB